MSGVSSAESAALVLRYLESSAFRRTAGTFRREASKLLKSIVTPPTVKPLSGILDEYVKLKEADSQRKQLIQANPIVGDLLAVLDNHASKPSAQHKQADTQHEPSSAEQPVSEPQLPANDQPVEVDMPASEPSFTEMDGMATAQHVADDATPAPQQADQQVAARLATSLPRPQSSSQHRKGAPRRRADQSDRVASPISRLAFSSLGDSIRDAAGTEWMNLPMTEDGFSSLMQDDSFQQRFAEGLATHLLSGAELGTNAGNHYDALLASLPADPAMAGLLEPLVLPADAYQIPADAYQLPEDACQVPADTCQIPADACQIPADTCQIPADACQIPADACQIPADACQIPADACQIPAETHDLLAAQHHQDQESSAVNQHPLHLQMHQTATGPARALESSATLCGQHPVEPLHVHAPALQQGVEDQQQSADQPTCLDGLQGPQLATASCPSLHCSQHSGDPFPPQLQQPQQQQATQAAASLQLPPETVLASTLPMQQLANPLSMPAAASKSAAEQSGAHPQEATGCSPHGKLAMHVEKPVGSARHQLQGASASMGFPAADCLPRGQGAQEVVRDSIGAAEAAALDSMYATIFPDRQPAKASSGAPRLLSTSEADLGNLQGSSNASQMDPVTVVCCNVSDPLPTGIAVTNPARLLSRKRQRSALNAQPASAAAPDQHSSAMFCGNVGAGPECVGVAVAQQQQRQQQQQQQGLIATAAPAQTKEAIAETNARAADFGNADCSLSRQKLHRPVLASLPSNQFFDAPAAGAQAGIDFVQPNDAAQQKVVGQGQNTVSFSAAAIEEFIRTLHGKV